MAAKRDLWPSCARRRTGRCASRWPRRKAWPRSPSVGEFVRQYSVIVDPRRLKAFDIPAHESARGDPGSRTWMSAGVWSSWRKRSSWCAGADTCAMRATPRKIVLKRPGAERRCCSSDVARVELAPGRAARHHRAQRRRRRSSRASPCSATGRRRSPSIDNVKARLSRDQGVAFRTARRSWPSLIAPISSSGPSPR